MAKRINTPVKPKASKKPAERKAVAPPGRESAPPLIPGATVAVRLTRTLWYLGRLADPVPGGFKVEYPTGEKRKAKSELIIPIPEKPVFRTGDAVIAVWKNAAMNLGHISALVPGGYTVEWDDGTPATMVPVAKLTFAAWR